ncbi:hypothetical protein GJAV_G00102540 [Gymnothorax javanicus]|nr:hypothetical protein GJAV_G00102540 [Gymnothorax javanicus]
MCGILIGRLERRQAYKSGSCGSWLRRADEKVRIASEKKFFDSFWVNFYAGFMETAIKTLVEVYLKSTSGKSDLSPGSFQKLVKKQLGNIMAGTDSKAAIKEMRQGLDDNQDGKVSFQEYMHLIGYLAKSLSEQRTNDQQNACADKPEGGEADQDAQPAS